MKKYFRGYSSLPLEKFLPRVTEKAVAFTHISKAGADDGYLVWFPKSQVIIGEANDVGNADIYIPCWLFKSKGINPQRLDEFNSDGDIVEM